MATAYLRATYFRDDATYRHLIELRFNQHQTRKHIQRLKNKFYKAERLSPNKVTWQYIKTNANKRKQTH